jgi:hypothetical protein
MVYKGWNSFQNGSYSNAIQFFENYFYAAKAPDFDLKSIPKTLHIIAHQYAAKSYARRDATDEDRRKAIGVLQELLRQQKVDKNMREIMKTLTLMSELHMEWGKVVSNYRLKKEAQNPSVYRYYRMQNLVYEEFPLLKIKGIEI